jgi:hypothetical protein
MDVNIFVNDWCLLLPLASSIHFLAVLLRMKSGQLCRLSDGFRTRQFHSRLGEDSFLLSTASRLLLGLTQPPIQWMPEALSPRTKQQWRDQEWWNYTATPPYVFMTWCFIKHRGSFTFHLKLRICNLGFCEYDAWNLKGFSMFRQILQLLASGGRARKRGRSLTLFYSSSSGRWVASHDWTKQKRGCYPIAFDHMDSQKSCSGNQMVIKRELKKFISDHVVNEDIPGPQTEVVYQTVSAKTERLILLCSCVCIYVRTCKKC